MKPTAPIKPKTASKKQLIEAIYALMDYCEHPAVAEHFKTAMFEVLQCHTCGQVMVVFPRQHFTLSHLEPFWTSFLKNLSRNDLALIYEMLLAAKRRGSDRENLSFHVASTEKTTGKHKSLFDLFEDHTGEKL